MNGLVGCLSFVALAGVLGCSGGDSSSSTSSGGGGDGAPPPDLKGVVFQGNASSTELAALIDAPSSTKAKPMPGFVNPPPTSEYLAGDPPPKFIWNDSGDGPAGTTELTYLQFGAPGEAQLLRIFTSEKSFTPTEAEWKKVSVGTWVTVDIFGGAYAHGTLQGSSAEGTPVQFCSMPPKN